MCDARSADQRRLAPTAGEGPGFVTTHGDQAWGLRPERIHDLAVEISVEGNFNPRIFHPTWFRAQGLLTEEQVADSLADDDLVAHKMVSRWSTPTFSLQVTLDELRLTTHDQTQEAQVADVVAAVLHALPYTPVLALTISRYVHATLGQDASPRLEESEPVETEPAVAGAVRRLVADRAAALLPQPVVETLEMSSRLPDDVGGIAVRVSPSHVYKGAWFAAYEERRVLATEDEPAEAGKVAELVVEAAQAAATRAAGVFRSVDAALADD